jgi:radical SAM superfamily enzyme YgiQ (UPF0313 family)
MGQLYRPLRHRSANVLRSHVQETISRSDRVGLVGSAVADLPGLLDICRQMSAQGLELGISSLRADRLTAELVEELAKLGMKTLTIAPEVGSDRLRKAIGKSVSEEDVLRTASLAADAGIRRLKLYFMVGLPWETDEDLSAIVSLVKRVRRGSSPSSLAVSVSPFVPKAMTPFQWAPMGTESRLREKIKRLAQDLRPQRGVTFTGESPRRSTWQGTLALGDRRVGMVLWHHVKERLTWAKSWKKIGLRTDFFIHRERPLDEILPWEIIDHGITKESLWAEYRRARKAVV